MAGPNKTYPAILGMVGLSLYLGNQIAAMDYEKRASEAIQRGALEYSLVSVSKTERKYKMLPQELACFCYSCSVILKYKTRKIQQCVWPLRVSFPSVMLIAAQLKIPGITQ